MEEYSTREAVLKLGIIDPELEEIFKTTPPRSFDLSITPEYARTMVAGMEKKAADAVPTHGTKESLHKIPMRDGHENELRVVHPETRPESGSPLVVLFHGGAYFNGTTLQLVAWARNTAYMYGATVALPTYRLAPEHKFPCGPHDAYDTIKYLAANASLMGADISKGFVIGGTSAGASLAISALHRSLKEGLSPPVTGLFASVPAVLAEEIVPEKYKDVWISREQNDEAPILNGKSIGFLLSLYQPDASSEDFSPFVMDVPFSAVPPTHIQVDGLDPLRDDGLIYARALKEAGVDVTLDVYPGCPHGHQVMWPQLKQSFKCQVDVIAAIGSLLKCPVDREAIGELYSNLEKSQSWVRS